MKRVSFIIPCYNSAGTLEGVVDSIVYATEGLCYPEIILSNDGSVDNTWETIMCLCNKYKNVIGINLARNFGQQSARMAAANMATGDIAIFMDDDGQHDPQYIPQFLKAMNLGYDIVYADFQNVRQPLWRKMGSWIRYYSAKTLEGTPVSLKPSAFFAVRGYLIEGLKKYPSPTPSIFGFLLKSTRNIGTIPVEQHARLDGKSGYTFHKLVSTWLNEMIGFSIIPLRVSSVLGGLSSVVGVITALFILIHRMIDPNMPLGYTSIMAALMFFGGIILMMLGIMGEYIGRLCMTMNRIPQYVIREVVKTDPKMLDTE